MFNTILVRVDESEKGFEALREAIELQKPCDADLLSLSVFHEHNLWKSSISPVNQELTGGNRSIACAYPAFK